MRIRTMVLAGVSLVTLAAIAGCAPTASRTLTQKVDVPSPSERSAEVRLTMDAGDIRLGGAAAGLVEGTVTYLEGDAKPRVVTGSRESTAGKIATVEVAQGRTAPLNVGPQRRMDLNLNGGLPMDLTVIGRSGNAFLDLALVDPKDLQVESFSGDLTARLSGPHPNLSHATFVSKSGETSIAANGEYPALEGFSLDSASGNVRLDLAGTWRKDFTAKVRSASGNVTLVLPPDVNVRVVGKPSSGQVMTPAAQPDGSGAFTQSGDVWTSKPSKPSDFTLTVEVSLASGNLDLSLAKKK